MNTSDHLARDGESLHAPLADEDPSGGGTCENDFGQEYYWPLVFRSRVGRFAGQKKNVAGIQESGLFFGIQF